jgi:hypothetical protein
MAERYCLRLDATLESQVAKILREQYADFGPTLARRT